LPCFHSVCGPCLESALAECSGEGLECPICSRSYKKKTLHGYLPNFEVLSQIDHSKIGERDIRCEECVLGSKAEDYCKQCVMNLCGACSKQHRRSKSSARHQIISLMHQDQKIAPEDVHRAQFCAHHRMWRYEFFCEDCDTLICYQCAITTHQSHSYKLPSTGLITRHRKMIEDVLGQMCGRLREAQDLQKRVHSRVIGLEGAEAHTREEINTTFDGLGRETEARCAELSRRLHDTHREWRGEYETQKAECSAALVDIWRTIDFLEKVISRGTDVELLQLKGHIFQEENQLRQLRNWHELVQRSCKNRGARSDIIAGWRSKLEADSLMRRISTFGTIEVCQAGLAAIDAPC